MMEEEIVAKVLGYSERGMLNSLFYEVVNHKHVAQLINELLALAKFADENGRRPGAVVPEATDCQIIIEQSFSDFGDADAVLLLDWGKTGHDSAGKAVVFLEAKVKTFGKTIWGAEEELANLKMAIGAGKNVSSYLFPQLYHKMVLAEELHRHGTKTVTMGVEFPRSSSKRARKIGTNGVVLRAVELIMPYCGNPYFISLLPHGIDDLDSFITRIPVDLKEPVNRWERWGVIEWGTVEKFCRWNELSNTVDNFEFNVGQIY